MLSILILVAGLIGFVALLLVAFGGPSATRNQNRRLQDLRERHSKSTEVAAQVQLKRILSNRQQKMDGFAQRFVPNPALLRQRLERTGRSWTIGQYTLVSVGLALAIIFLAVLYGAPLLLGLFLGLSIGIGLPHIVISSLITRRVAQFTTRFPDAIDLMVRGLRSGLPISETIGVVAAEIPGPVSDEFQAVSDKMRIGRTMEMALQETAERLGTPEFQFFVITLAIQRETGGNLAETLGCLADVLRKRSQMKLKIRAMSSEAKASAYIVGILPFIVFTLIFLLRPTYIGQFFIDERLMVAGIGGLIWMSIGAAIMVKMLNFEI